MTNLFVVIVGAIIFVVCAMQAIPSTEPTSTLQWWTYGMFAGLAIAAIGIYRLKNDGD